VRPQSQKSLPGDQPASAGPIELWTENGFSIYRAWEVDRVAPPTGNYHFLVRHPEGLEHEVAVEIAEDLIVKIAIRTEGRIAPDSSFWICCAERHLAAYVWEYDDYPPADKLWVKSLDPEDVMSAIRWKVI